MNSDATEAALGLLGLSPLNAPHINTSLPPQTPPTTQHPLPSPSTSQHPLSLADPAPPPPPDSDAISCICGFTYDDGFSIACDDCSRWCHAACFGIVQGGEVPEFWKCWVCNPEVEVDKERAVKIQKGRKTSPGVERKPRRVSAVAAAIDGSGTSKKKRRASILAPADPSSPSVMGPPNARPTPITFPPDIYPHPSTHAQLLRVAKAWRGVTAPSSVRRGSCYPHPPVSNGASASVPYPTLSTASHPHPRPYVKSPLSPSTNITPSCNTHSATSFSTTHTIPASTLLAPYTATIVPSSAYLADPLNGYAHLGMGKPQMRLVGGGWEVGLDARRSGNAKARWARCGCWPNAVVRPVICAQAQPRHADESSDQDDPASDSDADPTTLSFALFALRDLRADEEIVLGWEWDDGHAVHMLPALMESPGIFG
ncbi:hypothetical protein BU15DRAFT_54562 [Melanogaster broomeanus]|nr:hypothetical protein BU15DRAFT_54562 [Melanogaster broomeanus]